jgi:hypothetical protein
VSLLSCRQPASQFLQPAPVPDLRGDIVRANEHTGDAAGTIWHRLKDAIHEHLLRLIAAPADPHLRGTILKRLTAPADARDRLQALARQFQQCRAQPKADQVAPAYVPPVLLIGKLEDQARPGQVSHGYGQALEDFTPERETPATTAPIRIRT